MDSEAVVMELEALPSHSPQEMTGSIPADGVGAKLTSNFCFLNRFSSKPLMT